MLAEALAANRHNQRATAAHLGLTYHQLRHALDKHGLLERA
ncbi:MAG: helix-turn-helix domain-containing protein [Alphaproteobacteria bacterium]